MRIGSVISLEYRYRIKKYMAENILSTNGFVKSCGVSRSTVENILNGKEPRLSSACKICDTLGCSIDDICHPPYGEKEYLCFVDRVVEAAESIEDTEPYELLQKVEQIQSKLNLESLQAARYLAWLAYELEKTT